MVLILHANRSPLLAQSSLNEVPKGGTHIKMSNMRRITEGYNIINLSYLPKLLLIDILPL